MWLNIISRICFKMFQGEKREEEGGSEQGKSSRENSLSKKGRKLVCEICLSAQRVSLYCSLYF